MRPRAITGMGVASALGVGGAQAFFDAMKARPSRASERPPAAIASFDASKYDRPLPIVEVPGFDPTKYLGDKGLRTLDRLTKLLVVVARICLHDAGFKKDNAWVPPPAGLGEGSSGLVGVCCSNAYGSLEAITELDRVAKLEDARYINPAKFPNTVSNSASGYVSIWEDLRALNVSVSDGNCGALDAAACADVFLATGRARAILSGGGEAMSEALYLAFEKLGALGDTRLGEGAAFFALEDVEAAKARGAKILGEIVGYGTSFVAPPDPDEQLIFGSREACRRAIEQALADAGVGASDVDLVTSSVSGLRYFDDEELAAIDAALGGVPIVAPKLVLGETLGAGGAIGIAASLSWLAGAEAEPLVKGAAPPKVDTVVVTSVGYYGNASAVVVRRAR
jgi:3-oxoacyl-(acyl-carrier-protein) synthase